MNRLVVIALAGLVALVAAACTAVDAADACASAGAGMQQFRNTEHGYCLLYPDEYKVERPNPSEAVIVVGSLLNTTEPRVSIQVEAADGRTAANAADASLAAITL